MRVTILIFFMCTLTSCLRDTGKGCVSNYILETPLVISPSDGLLKVGDTLSVSMITDNTMLFDLLDSGRLVNIANYDPYLDFFMPGLDTIPLRDGFDVHETIVDDVYDAPIAQGSRMKWIAFLEIQKGELESKLDFKVVMQERGVFGIYALSLLYDKDKDNFIDFEDRCGGACCSSIDTRFMINDGDSNEHLLTETNKASEAKIWEGSETTRNQTGKFYYRVE